MPCLTYLNPELKVPGFRRINYLSILTNVWAKDKLVCLTVFVLKFGHNITPPFYFGLRLYASRPTVKQKPDSRIPGFIF